MRQEIVDTNSGAILFKKDQDSLDIEYLLEKVKELEDRIEKLEKGK